jgi:rhamnogalacturonyl hydrolase YesR
MDITHSLEKLKHYIESEEFRGYDPYDALNSPLLKALSLNQKYLRIAFIQMLKRLQINLRPLFGIRKDYNPKGIGLFLWGYAKLYEFENRKIENKKIKEVYFEKIKFFLDLLVKLKSKGYSGNCWGYNFDWQSRAFYVPKYTPTIVNSSFIGHALIDAYLYTGLEKALEMAIHIKDFILKDLNRKEESGTICFSYTPIDHIAVHNANLLGASLLIRLYKYTNDDNLKDTALHSLAYTMKYQKDDGSWYYAETDYQRWIDSFHTGFNLQSILYFLKEGFGKEYREAFDKGVKFYIENFFLNDGTPKYYHDRIYPIDIHSPAQAVVFFSRMGNDYRELLEKVLKWMIDNMQDEKGYFYFQKKKNSTTKIPYMRWSQAWAFHAMTEYLLSNYDI